MRVTSAAFGDGGEIPVRFCNTGVEGGENRSIPAEWSDAPPSTRSFVLAIIDRHPVAHDFVHWLVVDIPPTVTEIPEGVAGTGRMPQGAIECLNSSRDPGYAGPQPPAESGRHEYEVIVFALDEPTIGIGPESMWREASQAMDGHVLATAKVTGTFEQTGERESAEAASARWT